MKTSATCEPVNPSKLVASPSTTLFKLGSLILYVANERASAANNKIRALPHKRMNDLWRKLLTDAGSKDFFAFFFMDALLLANVLPY